MDRTSILRSSPFLYNTVFRPRMGERVRPSACRLRIYPSRRHDSMDPNRLSAGNSGCLSNHGDVANAGTLSTFRTRRAGSDGRSGQCKGSVERDRLLAGQHISWRRALGPPGQPHQGSQGHFSCEPMGFDVAGDYLFVSGGRYNPQLVRATLVKGGTASSIIRMRAGAPSSTASASTSAATFR